MIQILKSGSHPIPPQGSDIGYDLVAISEPNIVGDGNDRGQYKNIQYIEYDTGVQICGEGGRSRNLNYSLVYPRSSLSKYNLVLANSVGVIDPGYISSIKVRFKYIAQPKDFVINNDNQISVYIDESKIYKKGDKIAQLIFAEIFTPYFEKVDELKKTQRGVGGFGSTGL